MSVQRYTEWTFGLLIALQTKLSPSGVTTWRRSATNLYFRRVVRGASGRIAGSGNVTIWSSYAKCLFQCRGSVLCRRTFCSYVKDESDTLLNPRTFLLRHRPAWAMGGRPRAALIT